METSSSNEIRNRANTASLSSVDKKPLLENNDDELSKQLK